MEVNFLSYYGFVDDLGAKKLIKKVTKPEVVAHIRDCISHAIKTVDKGHPYFDLRT